jgi:hypothetical protein
VTIEKKLTHTYSEWTKTQDTTGQAIEKRTCSVCGNEDTRLVDTNCKHENPELQEEVSATCTAQGKQAYYLCNNCKHIFKDASAQEEIEDDADLIIEPQHAWEAEFTVDKEASCTQTGSKSYHCKNCEAKKDVTEIPVAEHQFDSGTIVENASCTEEGSIKSVCQNCQGVVLQSIDKLAHKMSKVAEVPATCTATGVKAYYVCSVCENKYSDETGTQLIQNDSELVTSVTSHTYGDWETVTPATSTTEGVKKRVCSVCENVEVGTIPVLDDSGNGDNSSQGGDNSEGDNTSQGGDNSEGDNTSQGGDNSEGDNTSQGGDNSEGGNTSQGGVNSQGGGNSQGDNTSQGGNSSQGDNTTQGGSVSQGSSSGNATTESQPAAVGTTLPDTGKVTYKVNGNQTVEYTANKTATGSVKIPITVTTNGVTYKVTTVAASAFKNNKKITSVTLGSNITSVGKDAFSGCTKLKSVTIGKNVTTIGKNAFKGCKKLKTITINSTKLKKSKVGSNAFKGISSKATIKVPKSKYKEYKKWFKSKGLSSKVKIKKK